LNEEDFATNETLKDIDIRAKIILGISAVCIASLFIYSIQFMMPEETPEAKIVQYFGILIYVINSSSNFFICQYLENRVVKTKTKVREMKMQQFQRTLKMSLDTKMTTLDLE